MLKDQNFQNRQDKDVNKPQGDDQNIHGSEVQSVSNEELGQFEQEQGDNDDSQQGNWSGNYGFSETTNQGSEIPDQTYSGNGENQASSAQDVGNGLATGYSMAADSEQQVDDLHLGEDGRGELGDNAVDNGKSDDLNSDSPEFTTGHASNDAQYLKYKTSGDLGEVDPGQQNYKEDQDNSWAFTAGDYKTSQEKNPESGTGKYGHTVPDYEERKNAGQSGEEE